MKAIDNPNRLVKSFLFTETGRRTGIELKLRREIVADIGRELLKRRGVEDGRSVRVVAEVGYDCLG